MTGSLDPNQNPAIDAIRSNEPIIHTEHSPLAATAIPNPSHPPDNNILASGRIPCLDAVRSTEPIVHIRHSPLAATATQIPIYLPDDDPAASRRSRRSMLVGATVPIADVVHLPFAPTRTRVSSRLVPIQITQLLLLAQRDPFSDAVD